MENTVQNTLNELRATRKKTLALVQGLSQTQTEFPPTRGKWSVGEVLDHLVRSERLYRRKFVELIELAKSGRQTVLRVSFAEVNTSIGFIPKPLLSMLEMPLGVLNSVVPKCFRETFVQYRLVPAQAPSIAEPTKGRDLEELLRDLRQAQAEMETLFATNEHLDFGRMRVIHPLMGDNNVPELLHFIASHEQRHQKQIQDILKLASFPKPIANSISAVT
jgi:uncharacterized damage-inducible protein DinB